MSSQSSTTPPVLPEIACYGLAGHTDDRARRARGGPARRGARDRLDVLPERFNVKDAGVLAGAVAAATERLGIATAATNHNTRHPS